MLRGEPYREIFAPTREALSALQFSHGATIFCPLRSLHQDEDGGILVTERNLWSRQLSVNLHIVLLVNSGRYSAHLGTNISLHLST